MGEKDFEEKGAAKAVSNAVQEMEQSAEEMCLSTPGGRFHVRWDENGSATAMGQLAFFSEFLEVTGLFARWVEGCPLSYTSPNAPAVVDLLGTWLLSILDGQRRYAHIAGLPGDEVAPEILGMGKIVSDESLRRALSALAPGLPKRCDESQRAVCLAQLMKSTSWMDTALSESTREALNTAWILDADSSVKLLYGRQTGAEIGYNPSKPGRPSHTLHTYWISNVRLVLDVEVQSGKSHAAKHSLPRLRQLIEDLALEKRPALVRGDSAFGNEGVMAGMEQINQRYLFKLRQTAGIKRLIERKWQQNQWQPVGQGFDAVEDQIQLAGWSRARRIVVLRRQVKNNLAVEMNADTQQGTLHFVDHLDKIKVWE
ncbi:MULTISPECIES: transposase [Nitrosomonas]|nr:MULTISPECIES: transposase [Nitrosomonas]UVS61483.1 transposase [Nitrosomonas sp. PLL12]